MALGTVRCALRVHKTENVKSQSFPAVQNLRYGHSLSSIIVINIKGCVLVPTLWLRVTIGLPASLADKSAVVLHVDSPINESRHASVLLPATLTTSYSRGPIVGLEASGPESRRPSVKSSACDYV
jgi:hypothetical protein